MNNPLFTSFILIKSAAATLRKIERQGKPTLYFNEQSAAVEKGGDFPIPFKLTLADDQQPYPPGRYIVDASSFEVGDYGRLTIGRNLKLIPVPEVLAEAAPGKVAAVK